MRCARDIGGYAAKIPLEELPIVLRGKRMDESPDGLFVGPRR